MWPRSLRCIYFPEYLDTPAWQIILTKLIDISKQQDSFPADLCAAQANGVAEILNANLDALEEGLELLRNISVRDFSASCAPTFQSVIGAHFRHLLEHYVCLLKTLDSGEVCYDSRPRDMRLEQDLDYALNTMLDVIQRLGEIRQRHIKDADGGAGAVKGILVNDQQSVQPVVSTMHRELLFLQSHTVHHYAMIAAMCRILGVSIEPDFGVAIATRVFEAQQGRSATDDSTAASGRGDS